MTVRKSLREQQAHWTEALAAAQGSSFGSSALAERYAQGRLDQIAQTEADLKARSVKPERLSDRERLLKQRTALSAELAYLKGDDALCDFLRGRIVQIDETLLLHAARSQKDRPGVADEVVQ